MNEELRPLARNTDPDTSHEAAEHARATFLNAQCLEVLGRVSTQAEPATCYELAGGADDHRERTKYSRRLPDLREMGMVANGEKRICRVTQRRALTWAITDAGRRALETAS